MLRPLIGLSRFGLSNFFSSATAGGKLTRNLLTGVDIAEGLRAPVSEAERLKVNPKAKIFTGQLSQNAGGRGRNACQGLERITPYSLFPKIRREGQRVPLPQCFRAPSLEIIFAVGLTMGSP